MPPTITVAMTQPLNVIPSGHGIISLSNYHGCDKPLPQQNAEYICVPSHLPGWPRAALRELWSSAFLPICSHVPSFSLTSLISRPAIRSRAGRKAQQAALPPSSCPWCSVFPRAPCGVCRASRALPAMFKVTLPQRGPLAAERGHSLAGSVVIRQREMVSN